MRNTTERRELSYDGRGINGPDEYRTRVATFTSPEVGDKYGRLFEAAPEMREALRWALRHVRLEGRTGEDAEAWAAEYNRAYRALDFAGGRDNG
jgi:hypothetical protein